MRVLFITIISIILWSCGSSKKGGENQQETKTIVGTWVFISQEIASNFRPDAPLFQLKNDSTYNFSQLLGAEIINSLPGKTIQFNNNDQVKSDFIKDNGLDKLSFKYSFNNQDSLLTFTMLLPKDSSRVYIPTKVILHDSSMVWNIDDFLEINLKRIEW